MKKLLHSLLLLSLVGSAMAVNEQDILNMVRSTGNEAEFKKLFDGMDMEEVQKTAEDLMYDISGDAAQLLISRMIEELRQKKRYNKINVETFGKNQAILDRSEALDAGIAAMGRDLRKLEDGATDPDQLETEAGKTALEKAVPLAMGNKIAGALGIIGLGAGAVGAAFTGRDIQQLRNTDTDMAFGDAVKAAVKTQGKRGMAGAAGVASAVGLYAGVKHTRTGRKIAGRLGRGVRGVSRLIKKHPKALSLAVFGGGLAAGAHFGLKNVRGVGLPSAIKEAFTKGKAESLVVEAFYEAYNQRLELLKKRIIAHDSFVPKEHKLDSTLTENSYTLTKYDNSANTGKGNSEKVLSSIEDAHTKLVVPVKGKLKDDDNNEVIKAGYKAKDMATFEGHKDPASNLVYALRARAEVLGLCDELVALYKNYVTGDTKKKTKGFIDLAKERDGAPTEGGNKTNKNDKDGDKPAGVGGPGQSQNNEGQTQTEKDNN